MNEMLEIRAPSVGATTSARAFVVEERSLVVLAAVRRTALRRATFVNIACLLVLVAMT